MYDKYDDSNSEKQRIFNIATRLMDKIGYEKLSIRQICTEAGISTGKFYIYFSSKQDLLNHFYDDVQQKIAEESLLKFNGLGLKESIVEFYRWYADYTSSFGIEFVINYFDPHNSAMDITIRSNFIMSTTDSYLEQAIQSGYKLPAGKTIHQISQQICMIFKGIIFTWAASHGNFRLSDMVVDILGSSLIGLLPES